MKGLPFTPLPSSERLIPCLNLPHGSLLSVQRSLYRSQNRWGFPDNSVGKESACSAGDPSSIPVLGRSLREGIGYPLQYSWASLVAQMVKRLPAMWETWFRSLDWEDPLEEGMATHFSILAQQSPWTEEPGGLESMGLQRVRYIYCIFFSVLKFWFGIYLFVPLLRFSVF